MSWLNFVKHMLQFFLLGSLLTVSACCKAHVEQKYIEIRPKPAPLPAEVLRAMQPNSTELLKKAEDWSTSSGKLLDSATDK